MKSLYFLPFLAAFLVYSAYGHGFSSDLSKAKLYVALIFAIIPAIYWLYDNYRGNRR